tara:strand:- start:2800 stop:3360 length:561 start_codon:yes stop_codon:yes gene_type:complete
MKKIHAKLNDIQVSLKAPKGQFNSFGKYKYRSAEDILEAIKPHLSKHNLTLTISEETRELGGYLFVSSRAVIQDDSGETYAVEAQAGINPERKGMDIAQSFGSSSSYAKKYALGNLFLLDDTKDADATTDPKKVSAPSKTKKPIMNKKQFEMAKEYLQAGGKLEAIESKYKINTQHLVDLKSVSNG